MEAAAQVTTKPANENSPAVRLAIFITDPEVAHELQQREDGPERDAFAKHALRIGVLALRHASGALDAQSIQREGERMLGAVRDALTAHTSQTTASIARLLGGYLDPATGSLPQRLERLTERDGEIESLLAKHLDGDRSTIAQTLASQVGQESALFKLLSPNQADGLVAALSCAFLSCTVRSCTVLSLVTTGDIMRWSLPAPAGPRRGAPPRRRGASLLS